MSICWAALLLGEQIGWLTFVGGLAVIACAGGAVRARLATAPVGRQPEREVVTARQ